MTPGIILLLSQGITVTTADGLTVTAKAMLLLCSADMPARAIITNMKLFNGEHGCSTCEDPGDNKSGPSALNRLWPFQEVNVIRTKQMVYTAITKATEQKQAVCSCMYVYIHILLTRSRF